MTKLQIILLVAAIVTSAQVLFRATLYFRRGTKTNGRSDLFDTLAVVTVLNFLVFWSVAVLSGGDALNGKVVDGQHFLGEHGRYTPVGLGFWSYSLVHAWITILSFVGVFLGTIFRVRTGRLGVKGDDEFHPGGRGTV